MSEMLPILVLNNHGQFNHLILRALRDLDIEAKLIPNTTSPDETEECSGVILGGGPDINRAGKSAEYLTLQKPILGICLGLHIIASYYGGEVSSGKCGGYGAVTVNFLKSDDILKGYPKTVEVWASHADEVTKIPQNFSRLATSDICANEFIRHDTLPIYGVQWHPEVSHTFEGYRVFENFAEVCRSFCHQ